MNVNGYYRKDGTYVRPYTRSAPRSAVDALAEHVFHFSLIEEFQKSFLQACNVLMLFGRKEGFVISFPADR